jgi:hypothetical protein
VVNLNWKWVVNFTVFSNIAKQFAQESGITGAFNLIGTNGYRDTWYIFPTRKEDSDKEIKPEISLKRNN